eukprot:snap_masked-scaffold_104-processed-gene-0.17-mRNA-1 protein AED:1.00 eAED:1.00 QI:0/0/0/0/1/1/2/0/66
MGFCQKVKIIWKIDYPISPFELFEARGENSVFQKKIVLLIMLNFALLYLYKLGSNANELIEHLGEL